MVFFHLAHAIAISLGAYFFYSFWILFDLSIALSLFASLALVSLLQLLFNIFIYSKHKQSKHSTYELLIISLGLYVIFVSVTSLLWGDDSKSLAVGDVQAGFVLANTRITSEQLLTILLSLVILAATYLLYKTSIGKRIKAVSSNSTLSKIFGIDIKKIKNISFVIGSIIGAISGILISMNYNMTPSMGFNWLLYALVAIIIGGTGKIFHLILGAFFLSFSQHLIGYYIGTTWMNATAFIILIGFLAWKPYGFSGQKLRKAEI